MGLVDSGLELGGEGYLADFVECHGVVWGVDHVLEKSILVVGLPDWERVGGFFVVD